MKLHPSPICTASAPNFRKAVTGATSEVAGVQPQRLQGVQLLGLQEVQLLKLHEETFLRDFDKKSSQEKRRFASRLPEGRRALAASPHYQGNIMQKIYGGQLYELAKTEPYTRRDGTQTTLVVWRSTCATCGKPFEVRTPSVSSKFSPNRRCQKHKRPGARVKNRRDSCDRDAVSIYCC